MAIILHVFIAIFSMIFTGFTYFFPSKTKLTIAYVSVLATIITGTYLIFAYSAHMLQTCIEGVIYLGVVLTGLILTRHKLKVLSVHSKV